MKKYTVEQWLSVLPIHIRQKAIANAKAYLSYPEVRFGQTEPNFQEAIKGSFIWGSSPEGHEYWREISEKDWGTPEENKLKQ